jgi:hypothetical protein
MLLAYQSFKFFVMISEAALYKNENGFWGWQ